MKNFKLILFLIASLGMVAVSCSKDDETTPQDLTPNINFKGGNTYISADATVTTGEEFTIGITASSNANSGKKLASVKYTITSNNTIVLEEDSVFSENVYDQDYIFRMDNAGDAVFMFEVTDKDGQKKNISLTITAEPGTTPLGDAQVLEWQRVGGSAGTGLDVYGLKWTSNLKVVHAVIQKDAATKLVMLTSDDWTNFTTVEELMAAVDAAEDMADYRGISAEANGTYDEVLGVIHGNEYFMIHLTSATVEVSQSGTTIQIYGESKK